MMIMMIQDRDDSDDEDDYDDDHDDDLMFSKGHHLTLKCCQKHNLQVCSNQQYFDIVYSSEKFGTTMQTLYLYGIALRMDLEKCFLESSNVGKIWISVFLLLALINMAKISNNLFLTIVFRAKWFAFEGVDISKQSFILK